jgi:hypothetical protein
MPQFKKLWQLPLALRQGAGPARPSGWGIFGRGYTPVRTLPEVGIGLGVVQPRQCCYWFWLAAGFNICAVIGAGTVIEAARCAVGDAVSQKQYVPDRHLVITFAQLQDAILASVASNARPGKQHLQCNLLKGEYPSSTSRRRLVSDSVQSSIGRSTGCGRPQALRVWSVSPD